MLQDAVTIAAELVAIALFIATIGLLAIGFGA